MTTVTSVTSHLEMTVTQQARLVFSVAVAAGTPTEREDLVLTVDGAPVEAREVTSLAGTRLHVVDAPIGRLVVDYAADVTASAPTPAVTEAELVEYARPSRYAESDRFNVIAPTQFAGLTGQELITAVSTWVNGHMRYIPGISGSEDSAIDTLLAGQGVCRDFAHLTIAMLRASGVPARLVAVYAPGLIPMDFHAVAEAALDGRWQIVDSTRMAPRPGLIRIATGRDAADTAFLTVLSGRVKFGPVRVTCYAHGGLQQDDPTQPVWI